MGSNPWRCPCGLAPSSRCCIRLIPWLEELRASHPGLELELTVETTPILLT
jgi:DNA-binding transcriptional LysR family regulator